jgi:cytidylate kinase
VTEAASKLSSDPHVRKRYHEILSALLPSLTPCILVGRDAWRFMRGDDCRFVIEADFETRLRRRLLHIARYEGYVPFAIELENHIRRADARDRVHLPTEDNITVIRLLNGRQPLHCTTQAALDALGAHQ